MTLYQFRGLNIHEQHEAVWKVGVHIGERIEEEFRVILYQIFSFYVELFYDMDKNRILKLRTFSSTNCLDAYLGQIDLKDLI